MASAKTRRPQLLLRLLRCNLPLFYCCFPLIVWRFLFPTYPSSDRPGSTLICIPSVAREAEDWSLVLGLRLRMIMRIQKPLFPSPLHFHLSLSAFFLQRRHLVALIPPRRPHCRPARARPWPHGRCVQSTRAVGRCSMPEGHETVQEPTSAAAVQRRTGALFAAARGTPRAAVAPPICQRCCLVQDGPSGGCAPGTRRLRCARHANCLPCIWVLARFLGCAGLAALRFCWLRCRASGQMVLRSERGSFFLARRAEKKRAASLVEGVFETVEFTNVPSELSPLFPSELSSAHSILVKCSVLRVVCHLVEPGHRNLLQRKSAMHASRLLLPPCRAEMLSFCNRIYHAYS